jgi:hypothetical protein
MSSSQQQARPRLVGTRAPFALVGFDVSGAMSAARLAAGLPSEHHYVGIITVTDGPTYYPATR